MWLCLCPGVQLGFLKHFLLLLLQFHFSRHFTSSSYDRYSISWMHAYVHWCAYGFISIQHITMWRICRRLMCLCACVCVCVFEGLFSSIARKIQFLLRKYTHACMKKWLYVFYLSLSHSVEILCVFYCHFSTFFFIFYI